MLSSARTACPGLTTLRGLRSTATRLGLEHNPLLSSHAYSEVSTCLSPAGVTAHPSSAPASLQPNHGWSSAMRTTWQGLAAVKGALHMLCQGARLG